MDSLAHRVKQRRLELKLTQKELAKLSKLKQSDISKIEADRIQEPKKILELSHALRCDPDWLKTGLGASTPDVPSTPPHIVSEHTPEWGSTRERVQMALDVLETELTRLGLNGRERIAPLFESFARAPGAVIKQDISAVLEGTASDKSLQIDQVQLHKAR